MAKSKRTTKSTLSDAPYLTVAIIAILAVICFLPLTKYFFLQDDFALLEGAAFRPNATFSAFFDRDPGLFRPLTKAAYFAFMYKLFGLNPGPYHFVSLLLHIINIFLFFRLLRQFKIEITGALITTSLFAMNVAFLDVIGWICCVQQLAGMLFVLLGLSLGIRAIETKSPWATLSALAAYILALMCVEQTYAMPLLLFLYAYQREETKNTGVRIANAAKVSASFLAVMIIYLAFILGWKGIPTWEPYSFHIGPNVVANLATYLDWIFDLSVVMPFVTNVALQGLTVNHLVIVVLAVYNLATGRQRIVVFGLSYYLLAIFPVLLLEQHTFYLHNYVPSFGMFILLAPVTQDLIELLRRWQPRYARVFPAVFIALVAVMSVTGIRVNERNQFSPSIPLPKHFVLRRAVVAENAYTDIKAKVDTRRQPDQLFMVYTGPKSWYMKNVTAALANASAPRLFFKAPDMRVFFNELGDTLQTYDADNSELLFFNNIGHCYTADEIGGAGRTATEFIEPE